MSSLNWILYLGLNSWINEYSASNAFASFWETTNDTEEASLINLFTFQDVLCPKYEGTLFLKFFAFPT